MMKKFSTFFGAAGVISLLVYIGLLAYDKYTNGCPERSILFVSMAFCAIYLIFEAIIDHNKTTEENEVLLSKKHAIDFCASLKTGTRDEFINAYGEEMYNHLLDRGVIHELYEKKENSFYWEFTKKGEFVLNDLKSL